MIKSLSNLFSKDEINTGRQLEFDIIKALAIIFMITVHVFEKLLISPESSVTAWLVYFVFGATLAAPVFMFAMGLGWAYTKHNSAYDFIKRGCYLLILGFILNILRTLMLLPLFLSYFEVVNVVLIYIIFMIAGDILPFAGLSFILWGLFKKFNVSRKLIILITIIFALFSTIFYSIPTTDYFIQYFLGLFINTEYSTYPTSFPLFTWFIFPVAGYEFAKLLRRCKDKNKFYLQIIPISILCLIIFALLDFLTGHSMYKMGSTFFTSVVYYYHHTIFASLHCIAVAITCLAVYNFLVPYIPNKIMSLIKILSSHITEIYVFSWLILVYSLSAIIYFVGKELIFGGVNLFVAFLYAFIILILSVLVAMKYRKSKIKEVIKIL